MADPVTLGIMAVGTAVSAYGKMQAGAGEEAMYNYKAQVAAINQDIANKNAIYAGKVGETQAQTVGMQTRYDIGTEKTQQAASGLDVNKGSAVDIRASRAEVGAEDVAVTRANAAKTAYGYRTQAMGFQAESAIQTAAARNTATATQFNVASTILSGASGISDKWTKMAGTGLNVPQNPIVM
jgi:hypothetical protein